MAATAADATPSTEQLYTRGGPNVPDNRGLSMVAKHLEKQQKEKEARAMERLHLLLPALGPTVRAAALQECNWDEERALTMLRRFQVAKVDELSKLHKERRRHQLALQSGKPEKRRKEHKEGGKRQRDEDGAGSGSDSGSSSGSESGSGSESESSSSGSEDERSRRKSGSKRRRSRSRERSSKRSKKEKRSSKDKKRKKEKRSKKEKKEKRGSKDKARAKQATRGAIGHEYGKYGLIRETDMYTKRPEFQLWAMEVKNIDIEAMPRSEEKEMFKDYMEEFNTATLPHRKYYDLEMYEKQQAAKAARKGLPAGGAVERTAFEDEKERQRELAAERKRMAAEKMKKAYDELRTTDKAKDMREQQLLRSQMELAYKTGDRKKAEKLAELLKPVDLAEIGKNKRPPAMGT
ncbi:hypothetical protein CHLNCDRAFT_143975 [Chlorella variabilis]|uniref:Uncharacterized protein n=1 Tax=Chlorella variabilis TaxID=554065 RepID=E1ZAV0_CHLVA|nr:hypothetical protein CHLNCDRAFT_143975 [Chlorella variabilis]EFN57120.1 hypothetical protein CHLNCDRAFT_143975 [Chlorella variabilis]|eukprot:XP_005849222.1 hypothetical protein CHLNCDRAFT_143975 [Chlorella variabilis]